jgi:putative chitinase
MITQSQLKTIYKEADIKLITKYLPFINDVLDEFEINTSPRIRMFLAQMGHESGQLCYTRELASGKAYEGRADLGNTSPGDGVRYKGRGLIQITGKSNYTLMSLGLGLPLLEKPELLELPENATRSAGWFWNKKKLNILADKDKFREITKIINGGYNGYEDRWKLYQRACEVIS